MNESVVNLSNYQKLTEQSHMSSPRFELAHLQPDQRLAVLETILFLASGPLKIDDIKEVTGWPAILIEQDLLSLADSYAGRGLELCRAGGTWRLTTAAFTAPWAERFLRCENKRRLSKAQLETLAIVAYRQPVTRAEIESYRGARSDRPLSQLEDLNLIKCTGRSSVPGHPIQYGTTADFLRYFGLSSLAALPEISMEAELFKRLADHPLNLGEVESEVQTASEKLPSGSEEKVSCKVTEVGSGAEENISKNIMRADGPSDDLLKLFAKITKRRGRSNQASAN
ncbi:MAG: SMC-Scp complex subunit ScpB [Candidatus Bruticola sp.]